jgi:hypothetical protein
MKKFDALSLVDGLERCLDEDVITEMNLVNMGIHDMAQTVKSNPAYVRIIKERPEKAHEISIEKDAAVAAAFAELLHAYGFRGVGEFDVVNPHYIEDFSTISKAILANIENGTNARENHKAAKEKSQECEKAILRLCEEKGGRAQARNARNYIMPHRSCVPGTM